MDDIFISYGRAESKAFAAKLHQRLTEKGYKIWFDQEDIPLGVDFQNQIDMGIELAHNFLFVIAPHSLKSEFCLKEVELAVKRNKRIIPILHIEPKEKAVWEMMHPTVSKLNWVYMRQKENQAIPQADWELVDDFEKGFEGLVTLIESHKDYVQLHTNVLAKALDWEKHERDENYLLTGVERKAAEEWLSTEFLDVQAPVLPTGLHAEYICESKEHANDHLTDVFFCYDDSDHEYAERFHMSLNRKGYTTWTKKTDLQAGEKYDDAVKRGIQNNSNFVYLISETSLESKNCLSDLTYALSLNKRVIPVMLNNIAVEKLPLEIKDLFRIDYVEKYEEQYQSAVRNLIKVIKKDEDYYKLHRELTVKSLEWQFRNKLQTLLLYGFDLEKSIEWLNKNRNRENDAPTKLITDYITESTQSRPTVFISYGRKHSLTFAAWLHKKLIAKGFDVWFDKEDIPLGVDFQQQIDDGIEKADNFLYVMSPHSVKSQYCLKEVVLAVKLKKRIIPILHVEPSDCWDKLHPLIEKLNWVYFKEQLDKDEKPVVPFDELIPAFDQTFENLYGLMAKHTSYVRQHTSILTHALDWKRNEKDERLLLSGSERQEAEEWLKTRFKDEQPPCEPTDLHAEYICESKEFANDHQTDVFLSYDETETEMPVRFHYALMQNALTTWSKETDVRPGDIYEQVAAEGIEKNTNFVFFISQKTLASATCKAELEYAIKLNKRIIPVLLQKIDKSEFPTEIRSMFTLDLTEFDEASFNKVFAQFKNLILKNESYYQTHRDILVKAIRWENNGKKQKQLLFGFDLEKAVEWLEISEEMREKPTTLQRKYISESSVSRINVFISYGRKHSLDFAKKLHDRMAEDGFDVWFDKNDIPLGVDFQNQIDEGIEKADNFLFVISPHSVKSEFCRKEIELAIKLNKRIIPLLHVEPSDCWDKMHPVIEKLNWIYFNKETETDFDVSYKGLYDLMNLHSQYVGLHTKYLVKAQKWDRNGRNEAFLLTGSDRIDAEKWLVTQFVEVQAPASPTDLHAEFICESKKVANSSMTDIFFSYARPDADSLAMLRKAVSKRGKSSWIDTSDIKSGSKFAEAINNGIEHADNFLLLISPESMASKYCLMEIEHILKLNKRIIPLLVRKTDLSTIPPEVSSIQFIDFTDNFDNLESTTRGVKSDFDKDIDKLMEELENDSEYHTQNKIYTVNALKWEKQLLNPSILFSGYELEKAEAWLKVGKQRSLNAPTELVEKFIAASRDAAGAFAPEVLICYDDEDHDFAFKLNMQLMTQGKATWFDLAHLPVDSVPTEEIKKGIDIADNILFILSPKAVLSAMVQEAATYSAKHSKRIINLMFQEVPTEDIPKELAAIQAINFKPSERDFNDAFSDLLRSLDVDREHIQTHTRILQSATKWEKQNREIELLLKGSDFAIAEHWLNVAVEGKKKPIPTELQLQFIESSREDIERIEREKKEYTERLKLALDEAEQAKAVAEKESAKAKAMYISTLVPNEAQQNPTKAVRIAHEAYKIAKTETPVPVLRTLNQAFYTPEIKKTLFYTKILTINNGIVKRVSYSADGNLILAVTNSAVLWNADFELIAQCGIENEEITCAAISPDSQWIALASDKGSVAIFDKKGKKIATVKAHKAAIKHIVFAPDSKTFATASQDQSAKIWNNKGKLTAELNAHLSTVNKVVFSADGKRLATAGGEDISRIPGTNSEIQAFIWDTNGNQLTELKGHHWAITDINFSHNGDLVATASNDGTVILWDAEGNEIASLIGHKRAVRSVEFSPADNKILTSSSDGTLRLWNLKGDELECFQAHNQWISMAKFVFNGQAVLSVSFDGTAQIRQTDGTVIAIAKGHFSAITSADISTDGTKLITSSWDKTVRVWSLNQNIPAKIPISANWVLHTSGKKLLVVSENQVKEFDINGKLLKTFGDAKNEIRFTSYMQNDQVLGISASEKILIWDKEGNAVSTGRIKYVEPLQFALSPKEDFIAGICTDNSLRIWDFEGNELGAGRGHTENISCLSVSTDSTMILTASADNTARLWDKNGNQLAVLEGHTHRINSACFSPDNQLVLTTSTDTSAKLWNTKGELLHTLNNHYLGLLHASFSPKGDRILTASQDKSAIMWDLEGHELKRFVGHNNFVSFVCMSANGEQVLTTSWDNTAKLWNLDGNETATFDSHANVVDFALFTNDGTRIVTTAWDKIARIWFTHTGIDNWLQDNHIPILEAEDCEKFSL